MGWSAHARNSAIGRETGVEVIGTRIEVHEAGRERLPELPDGE